MSCILKQRVPRVFTFSPALTANLRRELFLTNVEDHAVSLDQLKVNKLLKRKSAGVLSDRGVDVDKDDH